MSFDLFETQSSINSSLRHNKRGFSYNEDNADIPISQYAKFINVVDCWTLKHKQLSSISEDVRKCAKFYNNELHAWKRRLTASGIFNISAEQLFEKQVQSLKKILKLGHNDSALNFDKPYTQNQSLKNDTTGFGSFDFNRLTDNNFYLPDRNVMDNTRSNNEPSRSENNKIEISTLNNTNLSNEGRKRYSYNKISENIHNKRSKYIQDKENMDPCLRTQGSSKLFSTAPASSSMKSKSSHFGGNDMCLLETSKLEEENYIKGNTEKSLSSEKDNSSTGDESSESSQSEGLRSEDEETSSKSSSGEKICGQQGMQTNTAIGTEVMEFDECLDVHNAALPQLDKDDHMKFKYSKPKSRHNLENLPNPQNNFHLLSLSQNMSLADEFEAENFNECTTILDTPSNSCNEDVVRPNTELSETNKMLKVLMETESAEDESVLDKAFELVQKSFQGIANLVEIRCNAIISETEMQDRHQMKVINPFTYTRSKHLPRGRDPETGGRSKNKSIEKACETPKELPMLDEFVPESHEPYVWPCRKRVDWRNIVAENSENGLATKDSQISNVYECLSQMDS